MTAASCQSDEAFWALFLAKLVRLLPSPQELDHALREHIRSGVERLAMSEAAIRALGEMDAKLSTLPDDAARLRVIRAVAILHDIELG